jgi:hypothetical protein
MIPNTTLRLVTSQGVEVSGEFGISKGDEAHLMQMLRDTLYSDKVLAVLREYSSNAWDAHNAVGKGALPIKITLPTLEDPTLYIQDHGPGISQQDIFQVYAQYGASTKRTEGNSVGMFGLGCKSAFAYSDSFTVTSWNGGMKRTYVAVIDPSEKGIINQLAEEPCGEETGVLIQIAVRPDDIPEFTQKAQKLFAYFLPRPEINTEIPALPTRQMKLKAGVIYDPDRVEDRWSKHGDWVAVMGCVSYRIDLGQLTNPVKPEDALPEFLQRISGALYFNIGEVQISTSREELKYNDNTKKKLVDRFAALVDEYVQNALADIEARAGTFWERRLNSQLLGRLSLPIPKDAQDFTVQHLSFQDSPQGLLFEDSNGCEEPRMSIQKEVRFVIKDDKRKLKGFMVGYYDIFVTARSQVVTPEKVQVALERYIKKLRIDGIPMVRLSSIARVPKEAKGGVKPVNEKHKQRFFEFDGSDCADVGRGQSKHWEIVTREAQDSDVFVVLQAFQVRGGYDFYRKYRQDKAIATVFGGKMPDVYGYKDTIKKPVLDAACKGKPYKDWREDFIKSLMTDVNKEILLKWDWFRLFGDDHSYYNFSAEKDRLKTLIKKLGSQHLISKIFTKHMVAKKFFRKKGPHYMVTLQNFHLRAIGDLPETEPQKVLATVLAKYPLLTAPSIGISAIWESAKSNHWCDYVKMVDELTLLKERK